MVYVVCLGLLTNYFVLLRTVYNVLSLHHFFTFIMYKNQVCVQDAFMEHRNKILQSSHSDNGKMDGKSAKRLQHGLIRVCSLILASHKRNETENGKKYIARHYLSISNLIISYVNTCNTKKKQQQQKTYSRTLVARTLMARLPPLFRTHSRQSCRFGII